MPKNIARSLRAFPVKPSAPRVGRKVQSWLVDDRCIQLRIHRPIHLPGVNRHLIRPSYTTFAERARNNFEHASIFISACFLGVFAMSSEIVTSRGVQILLGCAVCYVAQNTSAVLAKALFYSPCVALLVAA